VGWLNGPSDAIDAREPETLLRAYFAATDAGGAPAALRGRVHARLTAAAAGDRHAAVFAVSPVIRRRANLAPALVAAAGLALVVVAGLAALRPAAPGPSAFPAVGSTPTAVGSSSAAPRRAAWTASLFPGDAAAMAFFDSDHGIFIGTVDNRGSVWRTADGGASWEATTLDVGDLRSVAVSGSHAWVSGGDHGFRLGPLVFESADGGASWEQVSSEQVGSLSFVDDVHGFGIRSISAAATELVTTADGGRTWSLLADGHPCGQGGTGGWEPYGPASVSFGSADHGWALCARNDTAGGLEVGVVETLDGGGSWTWRSRSIVTTTATTRTDLPAGMAMRADGTGLIWCLGGSVLRTVDAGATWSDASPRPMGYPVTAGTAGTAVDGGPWYLLRTGPDPRTLERSDDMGTTWTRVAAASRVPEPPIVVPDGSFEPLPAPTSAANAPQPQAIAFLDQGHGLVVGERDAHGVVWRTVDGGTTWTVQELAAPPLDSIAVHGTHAWASATCWSSDTAGCLPVVLKSNDGGDSWTQASSVAVSSLSFVDDTHGFGIGSSGPGLSLDAVLRTDDGGRTWQPVAGLPACEGHVLFAVSFVDSQHGWVGCGSGDSAMGSSSKSITETIDGGRTWTVRARVEMGTPASAVGEIPDFGSIRGLAMLPDGTGVSWLWNQGLERTTDGGATWKRLPLGDVAGDLTWPGVAVLDASHLLALTVDGTDGSAATQRSDDGGASWTVVGGLPSLTPAPVASADPNPAQPNAVAFFTPDDGLMVGGHDGQGILWTTADGGARWESAPLDQPPLGMVAVHGTLAWAAFGCAPNGEGPCQRGVLQSADLGRTWTRIWSGDLASLTFGDETHGFAIGSTPMAASGVGGRAIFSTSDGGRTWARAQDARPCGPDMDPASVSFVTPTHGWVGCAGEAGAGNAGKGVMETTDGGRTWAWRARATGHASEDIGSISTFDYLATISMLPDGTGFMTSGRCSTLRTLDGGRTWASIPPGEFDATCTSGAALLDRTHWYVLATGRFDDTQTYDTRLLMSRDQGKTWEVLAVLVSTPAGN
jgi:photosystem II stability/assembly factor-like uncharacterized protein